MEKTSQIFKKKKNFRPETLNEKKAIYIYMPFWLLYGGKYYHKTLLNKIKVKNKSTFWKFLKANFNFF